MTTGFLILICLILITIVIIQIGKVSELAASIRGEVDTQHESNKWNGILSLVFMVVFLAGCIWSAFYYKNWMLGFGPHESASEHGGSIDFLFNITLFFTGIVFILTHIALFWFAYKYRGRRNHKADFISHNDRLEIVWTVVPAVVMTILVIGGLDAWNEIMADVSVDDNEVLEIEATGVQFNWLIRYPGEDGTLGSRNYKEITGLNPIGQDWSDTANHDDIQPSEIVLPVNQKVRVRIHSRDVLHNFYLPHFRVKMDAVPGMPTYFVFTPTKTTAEYRQDLSQYKEYQQPVDPADPDGPKLWETFEYELACAELCGNGHFSMRRIVRIVAEAEYQDWLKSQTSYYFSNIRNSDEDPFKDKVLDVEAKARAIEFEKTIKETLESDNFSNTQLRLNYIWFETDAASLSSQSRYELDNLVKAMTTYPNMKIEIQGHTDDVGAAEANMTLSQKRAGAVTKYLIDAGISSDRLVSNGFGQTRPLAPNDSDDNRAMNRRTEFRITSK